MIENHDLIRLADEYTRALKAFNETKAVAEQSRQRADLWYAEESAAQRKFWEASRALTDLLNERAKQLANE